MKANILENDSFSVKRRWDYQKILLVALISSIVFNIGLLFMFRRAFVFAPIAMQRPLLEPYKEKAPRSPWAFTLAETPESARRAKPPERANHVSDKDAVAQNPTAPQDLPLGAAFSNGAFQNEDAAPSPELTPNRAEHAALSKAADDEVSARVEPVRPNNGVSSNFRREFLTEGARQNSSSPFAGTFNPGLKNLGTRAPDVGNFSLNTYAWEYAPYLLWLKNHVQRNIYPPAAFTRMGIISGNTALRFHINRDGTLQKWELLGYDGHKSLMETSVRAVQLSAPFRKLPANFPEEYLEVTAKFEYTVYR